NFCNVAQGFAGEGRASYSRSQTANSERVTSGPEGKNERVTLRCGPSAVPRKVRCSRLPTSGRHAIDQPGNRFGRCGQRNSGPPASDQLASRGQAQLVGKFCAV